MQLKLKRSQREGGLVSKNAIFCLDARVDFTPEERQSIARYKLANQTIYNSEASQRALEKSSAAYASGTTGGYLKSIAHMAVAAMRLNITISSLERGQHVECKSLDELLGAEEAICEACRNLKQYLDLAATFDGTEVLVSFENEEPQIVAVASTPQPALAAPSALPPLPSPLPPAVESLPAPQPAAQQPLFSEAAYASEGYASASGELARLWEWCTQNSGKTLLIFVGFLLLLLVVL